MLPIRSNTDTRNCLVLFIDAATGKFCAHQLKQQQPVLVASEEAGLERSRGDDVFAKAMERDKEHRCAFDVLVW